MLQSIDPSEYIYLNSYEELCRDLPGVQYASTEFIYDILPLKPDVQVLVTAASDFGIFLQEEHHPNADLFKRACGVPWGEMASSRAFYHSIKIGPTCDTTKCSMGDKYSVKVDRHTISTFNEIPDVPWFTVNLNVKHPNLHWLPFGLSPGEGSNLLPQFANKPKDNLLYVNFQNYTTERVGLKRHYYTQEWCTFREVSNLPVAKFLEELASHKFVLVPEGNGLDSHRLYETLYLGSVPVLQDSTFARYIRDAGLPVILVQSLYDLNPAFLERVWETFQQVPWDYSRVMLSHYRRLVDEGFKPIFE